MDFSGTYHVVSSPHFDDGYLRLTGTPRVTLRQDENGRIEGEYSIGVQYGTLSGHAYGDFIDFTFGGNDEMENAFGEGEATLDGDRLTFELWHYQGDVDQSVLIPALRVRTPLSGDSCGRPISSS